MQRGKKYVFKASKECAKHVKCSLSNGKAKKRVFRASKECAKHVKCSLCRKFKKVPISGHNGL